MIATHRCPGRCGRNVRDLACPGCTDRLPSHLAQAIAGAFGTATDRAREDARDWLLANPAPDALTPEDARISDPCNHCGDTILWLTTDKSRMPVNARPDPVRGNVVRIGGKAGVLGPGPAAAARAAGQPLWLHHVVTCPHADRWHSASRGTTRRKARR